MAGSVHREHPEECICSDCLGVPRIDGQAKTRRWLLSRYRVLGFDRYQRERLIVGGADWHKAEALLELDCSHELVVEILT